jgi:hypothetical protein
MIVSTNINEYTIEKLKAENKKRVEIDIFPSGTIMAPVFFEDIKLDIKSKFTVLDGKLTIKDSNQFYDFGFKLYDNSDGPDAIPKMMQGFNSFIQSFEKTGMQFYDVGIFSCTDKILFDLGYVGKMVKAAGMDKNEYGDVSVISYNYAETLITKDSQEYEDLMKI